MNFENIHNYYEKLVLERLKNSPIWQGRGEGQDFLEDVACVALNKLPPRYVRFDVDTAYFMSDEERRTVEQQVDTAITAAIEYVTQHHAAHGAS